MSQITPYISVADARSAIRWYADVFGATVAVEPMEMPDGRIGHAEIDIDGARVMMADAHPEIQCPAPVIGAGSPVTLHLTVEAIDDTVERARSDGALIDREPADSPGIGRLAVLRDPSGHGWMLNQSLGA